VSSKATYTPVGAHRPIRINSKNAATAPKAALQLVDTTSSTAVAAPGAVAITVASIANIVVGMPLVIWAGTGTAEIVKVSAVSGMTLTATFANTHSGTYNVTSMKSSYLGNVFISSQGTTMALILYNGNPLLASAQGTGNVPADYGNPIATLTAPAALSSPRFDWEVPYGLWYSYDGTTAGDLTLGVLGGV
jgi:hypothetical protein